MLLYLVVTNYVYDFKSVIDPPADSQMIQFVVININIHSTEQGYDQIFHKEKKNC